MAHPGRPHPHHHPHGLPDCSDPGRQAALIPGAGLSAEVARVGRQPGRTRPPRVPTRPPRARGAVSAGRQSAAAPGYIGRLAATGDGVNERGLHGRYDLACAGASAAPTPPVSCRRNASGRKDKIWCRLRGQTRTADARRPTGDQRPVTAARTRVAIISVRAFVSDAAVMASVGVVCPMHTDQARRIRGRVRATALGGRVRQPPA